MEWQENKEMEMGDLGLDADIREMDVPALERALATSLDKEESATIIRKLLVEAGTNVEQNDSDPYGDGDQTILLGMELEGKRQILRNLFASGGDIHFYMTGDGLTDFAYSCVKGDTKAVEKALKKKQASPESLFELLEYRQTSMRLSPLLLAVALSKHKEHVARVSNCDIGGMDHVGVVRKLLRFGARPDAKDVTGKTVCHYGAGVMATDETLKMAEMAMEASQTSHYFGMEVVLKGLAKTEYNGMRGTLGGYVGGHSCEMKRRVFHPSSGSNHELSIKPENIFLVDGTCILEGEDRPNLVDVQDRLGSISLHEVAMSQQRADVAEFLCKHSSKSLDIADGSGTTIRKMMCSALPGHNKVMSVLKKHAADQEQKRTIDKNKCENCGMRGKLMECSRCYSIAYCCRECQKSHWTSQHKEECTRLRRQAEIVLGQPQTPGHFFGMGSAGYTDHFHYGRPDGNTGQAFWIKVQSNGLQSTLMIYDQSRKCNFLLPPGTGGHRELAEKVSQQQAFLGRKSFFKAKFDEKGRCLVYLPTSAALQW